MKNLKYVAILMMACMSQTMFGQTKKNVSAFNKVIISPHIESILVEGNDESVTILDSTEPEDKITIEVKGETLRVYLDDAKEVTKHEKVVRNGVKMKVPIYKGKVLTIKVTYKSLKSLSVRGEQMTLCESTIDTNKFKLNIYGESQVVFNDVQLSDFDVDMYGESKLFIKKGVIDRQKITVYGEGEIDLVQVENKTSKLKAFGEAEFMIQSSGHIKFTAYGEAKLQYKGDASISKGISFGDFEISQID
ncbi:DUF2807 domain-containing protein [uncultured Psychroserpens sp.]|uniref:GIN domain-containing protein n=1 Tax=uncultured Psychroserpens sp. TaxID=255436 RepID=UPI002605F315|nr:DUF2807 domain-containing protein [uncultured Psychroserpens sp.]